jgi:deoxyribonuclease-4
MPFFGAHLSIAGGVDFAAKRAAEIGADCLQIFVKSPSQWRFADLPEDEVQRFRAAVREAGLAVVVGHASYLLNLASPADALWERSCRCLLEEWDRCDRLGLAGLVVHPGAHMGSGEEAGLARIAQALRRLRGERTGCRTRLLLETTAGGGSILCGRLEHLGRLLGTCDPQDRWLGVALDTCHLFAAGYDLRTPEALEETLREVEDHVGLARVGAIHANDAKGKLGSGLDRHEHIGRGKLGREAFRLLVNHPALARLAFILETPKEDARGREMDPVNLRTLRRLVK